MLVANRTISEWFQEAQRCYLELHQGCAWCGGSYRVFRLQQGNRLLYYCNFCDFQAAFDSEDNHYHCTPGDHCTETGHSTMCQP